jgi:hypothetical protein
MVFWHADKTLDGYLAGSGMGTLMYRWLDLVVVHRPESDFWRVSKVNGKKEDDRENLEGKAPIGLWAKFKWWTDLFFSLR